LADSKLNLLKVDTGFSDFMVILQKQPKTYFSNIEKKSSREVIITLNLGGKGDNSFLLQR